MIEVPIGGVVLFEGVKIQAVETDTSTCFGCCFDEKESQACEILACYYNIREDYKEIIFKEID
jgi:hypothetical protein